MGNILYTATKENPELLSEILDKCSPNILLQQSAMSKNTCFHVACKYNVKSAKIILASPHFSKNVLLAKNVYGYTCLHVACKYYTILIPEIIEKAKEFNVFDELIHSISVDEETCLHFAVEQPYKDIVPLLNSVDDFTLLCQQNITYETAMHLACKHNWQMANYFIDKFEKKHNLTQLLMLANIEDETCFQCAACSQPLVLMRILKSRWCTKAMLMKKMNDENTFLHRLTIWAPTLAKQVIRQLDLLDMDLRDLLMCKTPDGETCLDIAVNHQPSLVEPLRNSKHYDSSYQ